jgi:signal transduction histidine kinase
MILGSAGPSPDARRVFSIQTAPVPRRTNFLEASIVAAQALLIIGLVLERRRQRSVERTLQQQRDFEILVSELSSSVNMVGATDRPALVTRWLQRLGACLEVDRVSLVPAANAGHGIMSLELVPRGVRYPPSDFPALTNPVARGVVVRFARLEVLPPELASDRPAFQRHGIEAAVLVPLRQNGAVLGALALGSRAPRSWPVPLVERLEFVGAILANAVTGPARENGAAHKAGNGNGGSHHENEIARFARVHTLGGFALSLAHELNQPLSAILANAQAARRFLATANPPIDEVRAIIDDIDADDRRAGELIHAMRALLHNRPTENVLLDPNEVVRVIARLLHGDLLLRRVTLVLDLEAPLPKVLCDLVQLRTHADGQVVRLHVTR